MSDKLRRSTISDSPEKTKAIAEAIGQHVKGGETIELVSDLGGGKTTFVHGLASGAGSTDAVASPTFTISRQYKAGGLTIYHFDFYRLKEAGIMADELAEVINDPEAVVVVEWGDIVEDVLPKDRLTIQFENTGETTRKLSFHYPENLDYLLLGVD